MWRCQISYNGSGTFNINSTGQPVITGTVISSTVFNALTADLATGLSTAITKDGQTTATQRIAFAQGISITGVALNSFVDAEIPSGTVNGVNATFTLAHSPSPAASLNLFVNGLRFRAGGVDYTLVGATITFVTGAIPQTGDNLYANYRY